MLIGYARVSTHEQNLDLQLNALEKAGCDQIFQDKISGIKDKRLGFNKLLSHIRPGDTLVVWRLDRLGRSLKHLLGITGELKEKGIGMKSLQESIDTESAGGQLIFHIFAALAEFERNLTKERTRAGLAAARARGKKGGRPKSLSKKKRNLAIRLYNENKHSVQEVCEMMGITKPTLYSYLKEAEK